MTLNRFVAALLIVTQILFYSAPPVFAEDLPAGDPASLVPAADPNPALPSPNVVNLINGSNNQFDQIRVGANDRLVINILDALGQQCPECRAIWQGNSFTNLGTVDIIGFLALIAPIIINEGQINTTGGLLLSNLGIDEQAFYNGMAELAKSGWNPADSYILNKGEINAMTGKIIALIGANGGVHNLGKISVENGAIALVAGDKVSFPLTRDGMLDISVDGLTGQKGQIFDSEGKLVDTKGVITNEGLIQANGGLVVLSAAARETLMDQMINVSGTIEAKSIEEKDGEIILSGGDEGSVEITGTLNAEGKSNVKGGRIKVRAGDVEVKDTALLSVRGRGENSEGGDIDIYSEKDSRLADYALLDARGGDISGDGGFIEFSGRENVYLDGGLALASAADGEAGTVLYDPTILVISLNQFTFGANTAFQATERITVNDGVTISSRQVAGGAGGDHLTGVSTGNSGNLTFEAPEILVGSGAKILAQSTGGFTAGDVTFTATHEALTVTPLINFNEAEAKITINNATIKGDDISIIATAKAGRTFTDGDDPIEWGIGLLNISGGPATLFGGGVAVAYSDAAVEVNSGSSIQGTNVLLKADARSDATVTLLGGEGVMVGYAETDTTAKVTVDGATINASNDISVLSKADMKTEANVIVANLGTRGQAPLAVTFAGGSSDVTNTAEVKGASTLTAGNDINVHAESFGFQNVNATGGAYSDGVLGISAALSESDSTTTASLGGTSTASGDIDVNASMNFDKNDVSAASAAGSGLVAGIVVGGMNGAINGVFGSKKPSTTKDPESQPFGLAASFAYSDHENSTISEIADNASAKAQGDITVRSKASLRPETAAIASVDTANMTNDTKKNVAISAAVVIGDFENSAEARIGKNATVDAKDDLTVKAESIYPYSIQWDQINGVSDIFDKFNPNFGVQNGIFTSWAQSQATGEDVGIAGSVNILNLDSTAKAYIDENANINQDTNYRTASQDVDVTSSSSIETLNISGNFGLNPVSTGGQKGGIGVGYLEVNYVNDVYAGVKTGADVTAESLEVTADTITKNISIAESGGKGGQYGFNGAFSFQGVDDTTVAQVDDGATIVTFDDAGSGDESLLVHAKDDAKLLNVAGGVSKGGNVGIGASVSLNEFDRTTKAIIGNNDSEANSAAGSVSSDAGIVVEAENTGLLESYSLAAAVVMPDAKVKPAGNFGIGISGDVSLNKMDDFAYAYVNDSDIKKATDVTVKAKNDSEMNAVSGAVAFVSVGGTSAGLAGSYSNNDIRSVTKAYIDNSSVDITGDLDVNAKTESDMLVIGASGSGNSAGGFAIAGTTSMNDIDSDTYAYINNSDVKNADLVTVTANDDSTIQANAGSLGIGGKSSSGGSTANNKVENFVAAYSADSDINADDKITFDSSATGNIEVYAAALGGATAGTGSSSVSSDNEVQQIVTAGVKSKKSLGTRSDSDIIITATNDGDVLMAGGNLSLSGQSGHGRVVGINDIENDTNVSVEGARLDAKGKIDMQAKSTGTIQAIAVGGTIASGQSAAAGWADNEIENKVEAKIFSDSDVDAAGDITLLASDTSDIDSLAGVVAGGGKNSIGAVIAQNGINNTIKATIDDSFVTTTGGKIGVNAASNASIDALSASGSFGGQSGLNGAVSLTTIDTEIEASIKAKSDVDASGKVEVKAEDASTIRTLAGALTLTGSNSLGGSAATNDIANTITAVIDDSRVDSTGNNVEVSASETAAIDTISAGGAFSGSNSLSGSISLNDIDNSTKAQIQNTSTVTANQNLLVTATDTSTIKSLAGQVGGAGSNALAGAVATNDISNDTYAAGEDSTLTATNGGMEFKAVNTSTIETIAVAGAGAGTAALAGSVAINTIANDTQAYLKGTNTTADDSVAVLAKSSGTINTKGGVLAAGGTAGIGGTVVLNTIDNTTKAYVSDSATKTSAIKAKGNASATISKADGSGTTETTNGLAVVAESIDDVNTFAATAGVGGTGSINGTVSVNLIDNDTQAYIEDTSVAPASPNAAQSVKVRAYSGTDVDMKGGGLAGGGTAGIGATVDRTLITNTTKSFIKGSNPISAENGIEVKSTTDEKVASVIASGGIGGTAAVAGSVAVIGVDSSNEAYVENSVLNSKGDLRVLADDDVEIDAYAGSLSIGGVAGAGGSVVVTDVNNDITARITDSQTNAKGTTEVNADSSADVLTYTASGNLGGYAGLGGAVSVNTIANNTQARIEEVSGTTQINQNSAFDSASQDVTVKAKDTTKLDAKDGSISGSVAVGAGASIDVATVRNTTLATIGSNTQVNADRDVLVKADSSKDIDSATVAAAGGAGMGVAGSVSIINVGSAISGQGNTAAANTSGFANDAIGSGGIGTRAGSSDGANSANSKVNAKPAVSTSDEFSSGAIVSQTTTASIGSSAIVDAGGDITVDADDTTDVDAFAGTIAGGGIGVGGAVVLTDLKSRTNALVGDSAELSAGDDISIDAKGTVSQSDAKAVAGTVGIISLGAAYTKIFSDNDVTAAVGNSVKVKKADDLSVKSEISSDIRAAGLGANVGAATVGLVYSEAQETGTSDAKIGSNGTIGGDGATPAVSDVFVTGKSNAFVQAESTAASAGILSGNGSVATSTSNITTNASIGSGATVKTTNDVIVDANAISKSIANAQGTSLASGISGGVSIATANSSGNISSFIGDSSNVTAGRDIIFKSSLNRNADGTGILDAEKAIARASTGGGLIGAASANAFTNGNISTWATVGSGNTLKAGRNTAIDANAYHAAYVQSDASSTGGALAAGSVYGKASMTSSASATVGSNSTVEAAGDNKIHSLSQSFAKTQVNGGSGKSISDAIKDLISGNIVGFFTGGGLGSLLSFGGAVSEVSVDNTAASTVGSNATVKAGNTMEVSADGIVDVDTFTKMTSQGTVIVAAMAATDVFVDSDANVNVNSGAKVTGKDVILKAVNKMDLKAYAEAVSKVTVINAIASAMSRLQVGSAGDASEAKVNVASNAEITGGKSVLMEALNQQKTENLLSKAKSFADGGVAAIANTLADSTVNAKSKVDTASGSKVTTGEATFHAETNMAVNRVAESKAETITKKIVEVVREVVEEVCEWMPWPLDDLCDLVTRTVIDLVEVFTLSIENEKTGGSGMVAADSMNINSQIFNIGGEGKKLLVNSDGSVDSSSNIGATVTDKVYVNDVHNNTPSVIKFLVPKGDLSGSAVIKLNKVLDKVDITNNTNLDLVVNKVNMVSDNGGEPDVTYKYATGVRFDVQAQEHPSKLTITNNGTGDILFNNEIKNNLADFEFKNTGGDIFAQNSNVVFDAYHVSLRSDNGGLGSSAQNLNFNLWKAVNNPDGSANTNDASITAFSYGDMFLDITSTQTVIAPYDATVKIQGVQVGDLTSFGNIDVNLNDGTIYNFTQCAACHTSTVAINSADTAYGINNITAKGNVDLDIDSGSKGTLTGTITSGLQDITFNVDANGLTSSNTFNHELSRGGGKITLKDIAQAGGHIGITGGGTLDGTGTLKALDGYSRLTINNASGLDLEIDDFNVDSRINKSININGDANVQSNEYGSVQVSNTGYGTGAITINNTGNSDVLLTGNLQNSSGTTSVSNTLGSILNGNTTHVLKAKDILLNAANQIGTGAQGVRTDLQGGNLNATANDDIIITEVAGDMNLSAITATNGDIILKSITGGIVDTGDSSFGENNGAETDIAGRSAVLQAENGVGAATNGLELRLTNFGGVNGNGSLEADGGNGGVFVSNNGSNGNGLTIGSIGAQTNGIEANGDIVVQSNSPLVVNSDVVETSGNNIVLAALGNTAADDLTINANVTASGGNGNVTLAAGDNIALNNSKTVSAAGNGNINLFSGENWADGVQDQDGNNGLAGGSVNLTDGTLVSSSNGAITVDAAMDAAVASLQTGSNANNAITVTARSGAIIDAGDTRTNLVTGAAGQAVLEASSGIGSGNALETSIGNLDAVNTTSGNIQIDETTDGGNLGINRIDQQGEGSVTVQTFNGHLTVNAGQNGVSAKSGGVSLVAVNSNLIATGSGSGDHDLNINDTVTTTSGNITLSSSSRDVNFSADGDVTSTSGNFLSFALNDFTMSDGTVIDMGSGIINVRPFGDATLGSLRTSSNTSDAVTINAGASVIDGGDTDIDVITGTNGVLNITAQSGIGSTNALETSVGHLNVENNGPGNIRIDEVAAGGNLGINKVDQQGAGTVTVRTLDGNLTVNQGQSGVKAASGEVTLSANGSGANDDLAINDTVTTTSGKINLDSNSRDVVFSSEGDVTSASGEIEVSAVRDITQADGAIANSGTGIQDWDAGRNINIGSIQTLSGAADAVILTALTGEITDNGDADFDIVAQNGTTTLIANTGIGSADELDTQISNLSAVTDTGNVFIDNTGALNVVTANGVSGVSITDNADADGGFDIGIVTHSPLTVSSGSSVEDHSGGDIFLMAFGNLASDDLTLNGDVVTDGGDGDILLGAGDTIALSADVRVSAAGGGDITLVSGENFEDGLLNQNGNTGPGGGDINMAGTASLLTESGNVVIDAADDFRVGIINADSDGDNNRGDVNIRTRAGSLLDSNGPAMNITADELTIDSAGTVGAGGDPLEMSVNRLTSQSVGSMFFFNVGNILANLVSKEGSVELSATGNIMLGGVHASNGEVNLTAGNSILSLIGEAVHVTANSAMRLTSGGVLGTEGNSLNVHLNNQGSVIVNPSGMDTNGLSMNLRGNFSSASLQVLNLPPGLILLNGAVIGGAPVQSFNSSMTNLFVPALPDNQAAYGKLDGIYTSDFPGIFNSDIWSNSFTEAIDTSALDQIPSVPVTAAPARLPAVVQIPKPAMPKALPQTSELSEEEDRESGNPPAMVAIPDDAMPSQPQQENTAVKVS